MEPTQASASVTSSRRGLYGGVDVDAFIAADNEVYSVDLPINMLDEGTAKDEEVARALEERFRKEKADREVAERLDAEFRAAEAFGTSARHDDDAETARRMEQEASDAALAASLARRDVAEQEAAAGNTGVNIVDRDEAGRRGASRRRSLLSTCIACIGAGAVAFLFMSFLNRSSSMPGGGNPFDPAEWFQGGDWEMGHRNGGSRGRNNAWYSSTSSFAGLDLLVLNNLGEEWQETFMDVMAEWDNGDPDAVSFRIERHSDPSCRSVPGVMVVCNGDYGRTAWRGSNEIFTKNGYIVASVAKLNDFYLRETNDALRQYVCCHEVGHGLGLGHTDEGMYNPDLGECMDYTVRPQVNMHPGKTNFELLERMYGKVDGSSIREELQKDPFARRRTSLDLADYPLDDLEWRVLHRSSRTEHYESDLGDGHKVRKVLFLA